MDKRMSTNKPFILVTQDNEYVANCNVDKLTMALSEALVFDGNLDGKKMVHVFEMKLDRRFYVANVEVDSDWRAVKRLA
jgi:hypothetical protein